jgi:histidinol dehydrogenase
MKLRRLSTHLQVPLMARIIESGAADFVQQLQQLLASRQAGGVDISGTVRDIIALVRGNDDLALHTLNAQFDNCQSQTLGLRITEAEIAAAEAEFAPDLRAALELAAARIRAYHTVQMPKNHSYRDELGVTLGWQYAPIAAVGIYVPGGKASYPSSVLMNAVPAQVAGVTRIAMVVPAPGGELNPAVLVAAKIAGVTEIYRVGGAQAIAALAYGTSSIAAVDKIVGPGNAYVAEAKRQVFGQVGIDTIAGPSEILVVADASCNPRWIAADLLSQAEHDEAAQSILITDNKAFAEAVLREIEASLMSLSRADIARASWQQHGAIILVKNMLEAVPIITQIAPEHLQLAIDNAEDLAKHIRGVGAIFLGRHTPEAMGDYIAGPSHVLPTSRAARFSSGLSVFDFITRTSLIGCSEAAAKILLEPAALLADAEGLPAHALSLRLRR